MKAGSWGKQIDTLYSSMEATQQISDVKRKASVDRTLVIQRRKLQNDYVKKLSLPGILVSHPPKKPSLELK